MFKGLSPGAIGVRAATLDESLAAAKTGGFGGVEFNPSEIASSDRGGGRRCRPGAVHRGERSNPPAGACPSTGAGRKKTGRRD